MNRKLKLCCAMIGMFLCLNGFNLYAASSMEEGNNQVEGIEPYYDIEKEVDQMFEGLDPNEKILRDEDGGWMHGECTVVDAYNPSIILGYYNSETDPNSVTVEEAKQILIEEFKQMYSK